MKITKIETFQVPPRWLFLKVSTDSDIVGWGEPIVEGRASTVEAAVHELEEYLIGKNPLRIEDIWQTLYRGGFYRGGPILMSAISGVDQALWDIKGKYFSVPIYELLGGYVRDYVEVYSWVGGDNPVEVVEEAKSRWDQGYRSIKMNSGPQMGYFENHSMIEALSERVASVRAELGNEIKIGMDFHGRVHRSLIKPLFRELEQYNLMFIEEPLLSEHIDVLKDLKSSFTTPIALGERLFSRWDFKTVFESGCVDIVQPDLSHAGGISECKKIASMAEAYDVAVAPHCPLGPIALAACLQLDFCTPNASIQEQSLGIHYNQGSDLLDYLEDPAVFEYVEGKVYRPTKPGLGISINEALLHERALGYNGWKNPIWRTDDGCIAEW